MTAANEKTQKRQSLTQRLKETLMEDIRHDDKTVWPTDVAAAYLGLSPWTLKKRRQNRLKKVSVTEVELGPVPVRHSGNKFGYRKADLDAYVDLCRAQPAAVEPLPEAELVESGEGEGEAP